MARPRIGIPVPTSFDSEYNNRSWPEYAAAVEAAGAEAVEIPLDLSDADLATTANGCEAYLLPGSGADVETSRYGQPRQPETNNADPARERVDWYLLRKAEEEKKPLLCICFGTQSLNVFRGGTLIQDLPPMPINHKAGRAVGKAHPAVIEKGSLLSELVEKTEANEQNNGLNIMVNSSHHQALAIPGEGLRVTAVSPEDKVIEAVEGPKDGPFLLALQWHPERTTEISPTSKAIFSRFVAEAAKNE